MKSDDIKNTCHSEKLKFCRGRLVDEEHLYRTRVWWCAEVRDGYRAEPCSHMRRENRGVNQNSSGSVSEQ